MDLLTIQHQDFTMYVECTKFDGIWNKATRNVGEENLLSAYTWSDSDVVESVDVNGQRLTASGEQAPAIFFDNTDYPIWVKFKKHVDHAQFGSELQNDNDRFSFREDMLAGYINYGNDIGKSELNFVYQAGGEKRRFTLGYEVLSTKLNYHEHWKKIVEDIEEEYRMLHPIHKARLKNLYGGASLQASNRSLSKLAGISLSVPAIGFVAMKCI